MWDDLTKIAEDSNNTELKLECYFNCKTHDNLIKLNSLIEDLDKEK